jgi:hypothetical protein
MKLSSTSDRYQNSNLKTKIAFGKFLEFAISFQSITKRSDNCFSKLEKSRIQKYILIYDELQPGMTIFV